ncbi:MAG: 4-hydroxy-tetrahydrodipicolinate synthase [Bacteriovoracaceae bacterium]|nr:4-hydroxy-tetrahydrodipicolinate synthase [Bacteriovoracaceae bacterium]
MKIKETKLWTALVTPLDESGEIDFTALKELFKEQENAGNGILLLGSTGESLNLDLEERKKIIDFTSDIGHNVPLMVGVGGANLKSMQEWISFLENFNHIDAYLMVTPLYAKPGVMGQYEWFKTLMDQAGKPVMLYNIPSRTGITLHFETLKKLIGHKRLWALKEASGNIDVFKKYRETAPDLNLYSGDDAFFPEHAKLGARGLVSVASNAWPEQTALYVEQALQNKLTEKKLWEKACDSLFTASNPIPVKALLHLQQKIKTPLTRPPLSSRDLKETAGLLEMDYAIKKWFKEQTQEK